MAPEGSFLLVEEMNFTTQVAQFVYFVVEQNIVLNAQMRVPRTPGMTMEHVHWFVHIGGPVPGRGGGGRGEGYEVPAVRHHRDLQLQLQLGGGHRHQRDLGGGGG